MRGLFLNSVVFLILSVSAYSVDMSYLVPVDNMMMNYFDALITNPANNFGASTIWKVGDDNDMFESGDNHGWWHFTDLHTALTGLIDSIVCSLYVTQAYGSSFKIFVHRMDSTKPTGEGIGTGNLSDCGSSWQRYEEGNGGEAICIDHNWTTGGGDYYSVMDTLDTPTSTGWWRFVFLSSGNNAVVNYYNNIIDSSTDADSVKNGNEMAVGGLIFITNNTDAQHIIMTSDDGTNTPRIRFWGNDIIPARGIIYTKHTHQNVGGLKASMKTHDWPDYSKKVYDSTDWK